MSARTAVTNHVQSSQINMKTTISKSNIDIMIDPFPGRWHYGPEPQESAEAKAERLIKELAR